MQELPVCRWRGDAKSPGWYECDSSKLVVDTKGVDLAQCTKCYCRDHDPVDNEEPPAVLPCEHFGEHLRNQVCETCCGEDKIKVFQCDVYGEATIQKKLPDVDGCCDSGRCQAYESAPLDVLFGANHPSPSWFDTRAKLPAGILTDSGINALAVQLPPDRADAVSEQVAKYNPRIYINRAMFLSPDVMREVALRYPQTIFLTVNHSSQTHLASSIRWLPDQKGHIQNTVEFRNCWFGTPDERNAIGKLVDNDRVVWLPNAVRFPQPHIASLGSRARLSIICRWDVLKNIPNQIVAAGIANHTHQSELISSFRKPSTLLTACVDTARLPHRSLPWGDWAAYIKNIKHHVDIGLQVSFTESFNYVALEHLLCGKPVIGSPAIRFLPQRWQASPDDPDDIADKIKHVIDNYDNESKEALRIGRAYGELCNHLLVQQMKKILNRSPVLVPS